MSDEERGEIWRLTRQGMSVRALARHLGRSAGSIQGYMKLTGGVRPRTRSRAAIRLSVEEREEIFGGLVAGESLRAIGRRLGRSPSTTSREVTRNGGAKRYRPQRADAQAWARACRPKECKLVRHEPLRALVAQKLDEDWSPQQISGWLKVTFPDSAEMHVSHETIYLTLLVQARGTLKRELTEHLRSRRHQRQTSPKATGDGHSTEHRQQRRNDAGSKRHIRAADRDAVHWRRWRMPRGLLVSP